jgi:transglutaminase-like putative cysteine protease/tetratricopeptide (TPR) repeat protein
MAAAFVPAQQAVWPLDGPAFSASVQDLRDAAGKVTPEKFALVTVLFEREAYVINADGRVDYRHSMIYRIEDQAAIDDWSQVDADWEPWFQNMPEIHARVIDPDGKVSELDQKTVADGPANEDDAETYTDARIRKAPLPGLKVGSMVEQEIRIVDKQPFFSGGGVYRDDFSRPVPIVREQLTISAPTQRLLQYRVHAMPEVKVSDSAHDAVRTLSFDEPYQASHADGDIDLPTHDFDGPMVEFSTGESWPSVAEAYRKLADPQIDLGQVRNLVPNASEGGRMQRIQRAVSWLDEEIRYTGVEFGESSLQPQKPAEVLKRHFGDCKDKATLLVALLRSSGVPADLALLDAGPGIDVNAELPGMNQFDHAIVYVPGEGKDAPLWIDATDQFAQVGTLPSMDQGREALVIADGTAGLTQIPIGNPEDNLLTELRDVTMSEYGAAHITETSVTHGPVDAEYREEYGGADTRERRTNLEDFAKNYYLAKALTSVSRGDAKDLSQPFTLKLDMVQAKRGNTGVADAAVAIPFTSIFNQLPAWFKTDPGTTGVKLTPQQEDNRMRAVAARVADYDVVPFATEWHYTITPPPGFELRALPEDRDTAMGPGRLTAHYAVDGTGAVTAVLRFTTTKPRYTAAEALALRDAVLDAYKQDMIMVLFDQVGSKLMAAGKIRDALSADRELIDRRPQDAVHHAQFANILLQAGLGDMARIEARLATKLDPNSIIAFKTLGSVCQFNGIGVQWGDGADRNCSEDAYAKAAALDSDDLDTAVDLAIAHEYDEQGNRYTPGAHLDQAIAAYKALRQKDKATADQYEDYMLWDLLFAHQYKELLSDLDTLPSSANRNGLAVAAAVAQLGGDNGVKAGLDRANHLAGGAQERSAALAAAGGHLANLRMYPQAAAILSAAAEGQNDSAHLVQTASIFRRLPLWNGDFLPSTDPRSVVQMMVLQTFQGTLNQQSAEALLSRHAYGSDEEWNKNLEIERIATEGLPHLFAENTGLPPTVFLDLMSGNMQFSSEGSDEKGYNISMQSLGSKARQFFVSKDDGRYVIVTDGDHPSEAGNEVLYLLSQKRDAEAQFLLDWMRERLHLGGGDDPLDGPLFPRFWTLGKQGDEAAMRVAAQSLIAGTSAIEQYLPQIRNAWKSATGDEEKLNLALLLATGYRRMNDGPRLKEVSTEILSKYPDSYTAIRLAGNADALLKDWKDWDNMLDTRIAKRSDDENLLRMKVSAQEAQGDFAGSRQTEQKIMDLGKATASDYNSYAWSALFDGKVDADVTKDAQQAVMLSNNASFAEMHTLACIYAYQGKTVEARDLLLKAMKTVNQAVPNPEVWFGFAMIYEKYGLDDAAMEAYSKVEKPDSAILTDSTYLLANQRLQALRNHQPSKTSLAER